MVATAPPADRWLLIEYRDAWPRLAADVVGDLAPRITELCERTRTRPVLIRRHGRYDRTASRRWGLADCRPGRESMRWGQLSAYEHLLDVLQDEDPGVSSDEPVYLVCAHGRHDACCAVRGRPVAAALSAAYAENIWECSHVGGDRFAANLVVLPDGLMYGHVTEASALQIAAGAVVPELLRGRTAFPAQVQAAQHYAGVLTEPKGVKQVDDDTWTVDLGTAVVTVRQRYLEIDGAMTCASRPPGRVRTFDLV